MHLIVARSKAISRSNPSQGIILSTNANGARELQTGPSTTKDNQVLRCAVLIVGTIAGRLSYFHQLATEC